MITSHILSEVFAISSCGTSSGPLLNCLAGIYNWSLVCSRKSIFCFIRVRCLFILGCIMRSRWRIFRSRRCLFGRECFGLRRGRFIVRSLSLFCGSFIAFFLGFCLEMMRIDLSRTWWVSFFPSGLWRPRFWRLRASSATHSNSRCW